MPCAYFYAKGEEIPHVNRHVMHFMFCLRLLFGLMPSVFFSYRIADNHSAISWIQLRSSALRKFEYGKYKIFPESSDDRDSQTFLIYDLVFN